MEISFACSIITVPPARSEVLHPQRRIDQRLICHGAFQPSSLLSPVVVLVTALSKAPRTMITLPAKAMRIIAALTGCIQTNSGQEHLRTQISGALCFEIVSFDMRRPQTDLAGPWTLACDVSKLFREKLEFPLISASKSSHSTCEQRFLYTTIFPSMRQHRLLEVANERPLIR